MKQEHGTFSRTEIAKENLKLTEVATRCWSDLIGLSCSAMTLPEIHMAAEKLVQYTKSISTDDDIRWLRARIDAAEQWARAELTKDPDNLDQKRLHAALSGAQAGFSYPLGRSPRDLNWMAF